MHTSYLSHSRISEPFGSQGHDSENSGVYLVTTHLVLPPVAMTTPFLARMFTSLSPNLAVIPVTFPEAGFSRMILVSRCFNRISTPLTRALFSNGRTTPDPGLPLMVSLRSGENT